MANRNRPAPGQHQPPDLRGLAERRLLDPAGEEPTQELDVPIEAWPTGSAEVEVVFTPSTEEPLAMPQVRPLGPPPKRPESRLKARLMLVAVALGLFSGILFGIGAVWLYEPIGTKRWLTRTAEWLADGTDDAEPVHAAPPADEARMVEPASHVHGAPDGSDAPAAPSVVEEAPRVEPPALPAARPRPPRPQPVAIPPKPVPMVKPYEERPRPALPRTEDGLLLER